MATQNNSSEAPVPNANTLIYDEKAVQDVVVTAGSDASSSNEDDRGTAIPLRMKILAVLLVTAVGFGSHWSSGVTGAMKSTLKKRGVVSDRLVVETQNQQCAIRIYSVGAILIAAATTIRNYRFMIFGVIVQALGDVATQVAQYKVFSSWFAPSHGFASTLGFELGIGKMGSFVGKATANIIAKKTGDFSWVYWTAVFMNLFTNVVTVVFYFFTIYCGKKYGDTVDPATKEKLTEKGKKLEFGKMLRLPWTFWSIVTFSLFQTSTAAVYSQNATEMAEQRFKVNAIKAGWYSATSQYLGFFLVPLIGIFVDLFGNRLTLMLICGVGMLISMCLAAWGPIISGTAASFGIYAVASSFGPTVIIDAIRTSMWYQEVFGSGYAVKVAVNNSMKIIIRIVTGVIQDRDKNSYDNVVKVYVVLATGSVVIAAISFIFGFFNTDLGHLFIN